MPSPVPIASVFVTSTLCQPPRETPNRNLLFRTSTAITLYVRPVARDRAMN